MKFKELKFRKLGWGGINATHHFDNGLILSVAAGKTAYCTPREDLNSEKEHSSFEIAILHKDNIPFFTKLVKPGIDDDVIGWVGREDIDEIFPLIDNITEDDISNFIIATNLLGDD